MKRTIIGTAALLLSMGIASAIAGQDHPKPQPCTFAVSGMT